ncbi:hypothetical protein Tco_0811837 [Tanacetum coccineum]
MDTSVVMLNDDIKASAEYLEYLAKSKGVAPVKTGGKGLLTKEWVEITMERVSIPKGRRSKIVTEAVGESEGIDDDEVDSEETVEDEEPLVRTRPSELAIGGEAHQESEEERVNHSKKLKGLETLGSGEGSDVTREVPDELVFKSSNEGAGVTPEVPDEPSDYSSSLSSNSEFRVEYISSDEAEVTKKANNAKIVDAKKDTKDQVAEEQGAAKQPGNEELDADQGDNEPAGDAQADVQMTDAQLEKPEATLIGSHQTLSSANFTSQFLNDNPQINVNNVLKDPVKPEVQSMVDIPVTQEKHVELRPPLVDTTVTLIPETTIISPTQPPQTQPKRRKTKVILKKSNKLDSQVNSGELKCKVTRHEKKVHAMSSFNLPEAIDKSVKAHLKNVLPKDVPYCGKIKLEKAKKSMPKNSSTPVDQAALDEFEEKD